MDDQANAQYLATVQALSRAAKALNEFWRIRCNQFEKMAEDQTTIARNWRKTSEMSEAGVAAEKARVLLDQLELCAYEDDSRLNIARAKLEQKTSPKSRVQSRERRLRW